MWIEIEQLKQAVDDWTNSEKKAADRRAQGQYPFSILDVDQVSEVPNFERLLSEVATSRSKLIRILPIGFDILAALAVVGPEELWQEAACDRLITLTQEVAGELARFFPPGTKFDDRGNPALDFTAAWLLRDGHPAPRACQMVQDYVLATIQAVLAWLQRNAPGFSYSPGDAGTLAGAVIDLLFGWSHTPCPCCAGAVKKLKDRAAKGKSLPQYEIDFEPGLLPEALQNKEHHQRSNEERHVVNCFSYHRFRAYVRFALVLRLALAQFLRQAIRGSAAEISKAFLKAGMLYPLLEEKYSLHEVNVACVQCDNCTNEKKELVRKWHDKTCPEREKADVTRCTKCKIKYEVAEVYSWNLKQCSNCQSSFKSDQRVVKVKMHIVTSCGSGFSAQETHTCPNEVCGTIFTADHCKLSADDHKDKGPEAPHDKCPKCDTPHRGAPTPDDPEPDQRSFRTSEVYWFEESGGASDGPKAQASTPKPVVPRLNAASEKRQVDTPPEQSGGEPWQSELINFMAANPKKGFRCCRLPSESELQDLLAKWRKIDGAPKSYAELCQRWAGRAKEVAIRWATESGWEPWAIEVVELIPAQPDGSFRLDHLPPKAELQPLLAKWKQIQGAPKTCDELCEKWYDLIAEQNTSDARSEFEGMITEDFRRSQEDPPE